MKEWHIPELLGIEEMKHICPSLESFNAWCVSHQAHELIARAILSHAESSDEADRVSAGPTGEEGFAISWIAEVLLSLKAGGTGEPWWLMGLRIIEEEYPDDTSLPWEE